MKYITYLIAFFFLVSCTGNTSQNAHKLDEKKKKDLIKKHIIEKKITHYTSHKKEIEKAKVIIEQKYGEQWDFCNCVVKGDSINTALAKENISDKEFDILFKRFDYISNKCQAFKIESQDRTPEERDKHQRKVNKCLKEYKRSIKKH